MTPLSWVLNSPRGYLVRAQSWRVRCSFNMNAKALCETNRQIMAIEQIAEVHHAA
ncbi:MAG: hypothetical protein HW416_664 [Chloroflexi bacterium]|nr:hypothetical protein [Chloroflexota bacterium]